MEVDMKKEDSGIHHLAKLLRDNGERILSGCSKLSFTAALLQNLNEAFTLIVKDEVTSSFDVLPTSNTQEVFLHDLQFLYDFVQKTVGLKIIHDASTLRGNINIAKFHSLQTLELKKVPIHMVVGLQSVRSQLRSLTVSRCFCRIEDLFSTCGGDRSLPFNWDELREAVLTFNGISDLDSSLKLLPWLEVLDLSYNKLSNIQALQFLSDIVHLNLSFNLIEHLPRFSKGACMSLKTLILKNNSIESIEGVEALLNLHTLDASYNCLSDHDVLAPLSLLPNLRVLKLMENPLSFHIFHRELTVEWLHVDAVNPKFLLDKHYLTKSEQNLVIQRSSFPKILPALEIAVASTSGTRSMASCGGSEVSFPTTPASCGESESDSLPADIPTEVNTSKRGPKKSNRAREAVIVEPDLEETSENCLQLPATSAVETASSVTQKETSDLFPDHLQTKQKIEELRRTFGEDNWLHGQGGDQVHRILGFKESLTTVGQVKEEEICGTVEETGEVTPVDVSEMEMAAKSRDQKGGEEKEEEEEQEESMYSAGRPASRELSVEMCQWSSSSEDENENEQHIFLVKQNISEGREEEEFLLTVSSSFIREKDIGGHTKAKWHTPSIESCVKASISPIQVHLGFNTVRRDKKERLYYIEEEDYQELYAILQPFLHIQAEKIMVQGAMQCMKCSGVFSQEVTGHVKLETTEDEMLVCPNCGSNMVIEADSNKIPGNSINVQDNLKETKLMPYQNKLSTTPETDSLSDSVNTIQHRSFKQVRSHRVKVPHDVSLPICATEPTGTTLSSPSTPPCGAKQGSEICVTVDVHAPDMTGSTTSFPAGNSPGLLHQKPSESDIEVLSNPSQSSIEILGPLNGDKLQSSTGGSELLTRQLVLPTEDEAPFESPEKTVRTHSALQESSSSGSLAESVCTAYENNAQSPTSRLISPREKPQAVSQLAAGTIFKSPDIDEFDVGSKVDDSQSQPAITIVSADTLDPAIGDVERKCIVDDGRFSSHSITDKVDSERQTFSSSGFAETIYRNSEGDAQDSGKLLFEHDSLYSDDNFGENRARSKSVHEESIMESVLDRSATSIENKSQNSLSRDSCYSQSELPLQTGESSDLLAAQDNLSGQIYEDSTVHTSKTEIFGASFEKQLVKSTCRGITSSKEENTDPEGDEQQLEKSAANKNTNEESRLQALSRSQRESACSYTDLQSRKQEREGKRGSGSREKNVKYSYTNFLQVDHRLKLYFDVTLFRETEEELVSLLRGGVLSLNSTEEYPGLLVISNRKIYILKVTGEESDQPETWLQKVESRPLAQVVHLLVLIGKQGVGLEIKDGGFCSYAILLRDEDRTSAFVSHLIEFLPKLDSGICVVKDVGVMQKFQIHHQLFSTAGAEDTNPTLLLCSLGFILTKRTGNGEDSLQPMCMIVTPTDICLTNSDLRWLMSKTGKLTLMKEQKMSNLTALELYDNDATCVTLQFLNEDSREVENWDIALETEGAVQKLIGAIRGPWEALFAVELQVTCS